MIHHNFTKCHLQKKKIQHAITVSDHGTKWLQTERLWQVHCGRTDSYMGVSELSLPVCSSLHLAGCHLICYRRFELVFTHASSRLSRLAGGEDTSPLFTGQELSHSQVTHQSPGCDICEVEQQKCKNNICLLFLFPFPNIKRWTDGWRGNRGKEMWDGCSAWMGCRFIVKNPGERDQYNICCLH